MLLGWWNSRLFQATQKMWSLRSRDVSRVLRERKAAPGSWPAITARRRWSPSAKHEQFHRTLSTLKIKQPVILLAKWAYSRIAEELQSGHARCEDPQADPRRRREGQLFLGFRRSSRVVAVSPWLGAAGWGVAGAARRRPRPRPPRRQEINFLCETCPPFVKIIPIFLLPAGCVDLRTVTRGPRGWELPLSGLPRSMWSDVSLHLFSTSTADKAILWPWRIKTDTRPLRSHIQIQARKKMAQTTKSTKHSLPVCCLVGGISAATWRPMTALASATPPLLLGKIYSATQSQNYLPPTAREPLVGEEKYLFPSTLLGCRRLGLRNKSLTGEKLID